ncbi:MAG: hypothetical protein JXQ71_07390 [Verrucomicrobia bacterium]|nr:hypothetical protein [Verrucomicrobiota bacterium]
MPAAARLEPPFRRVLALDPGSRTLRLALVELAFGRIRVLSEQSLNVPQEGSPAPEAFQAQLHARLAQLGQPPLALTLPQHLSTSQIFDLPAEPGADVASLVEAEITRLSGVSDSAFIYDVIRLDAPARGRQPFWVTLCQERELRNQVRVLGLTHEALCEITTTANALIAAFRAACPATPEAILIHTGAQNTVLVIVVGGQGVLATSFATGGDYFTRAIAAEMGGSPEGAEALKRTRNLFVGADALPALLPKVDAWLSQVTQVLNDWFETAPPTLKLAAFRIVACGCSFDQPGLLDYLKTRSGLPLERWPVTGLTTTDHPARGFEVAFGTALHALHRTPQPVSLLPADHRQAWRKRLMRQWIDCASGVLAVVLFFLLCLGSWQAWRLWRSKESLQARAQQSLEHLRRTQLASTRLLTEYEAWRPLLACQKLTFDTLDTLALLQQSRSNRNFWYVLFGDQTTYFTRPLPPPLAPPGATNPPASPPGPAAAPPPTNAAPVTARALAARQPTNTAPARPGFIAELCIAEEADAARRMFSQVVSELKHVPLFAKVDALSGDLRRNLADPKVLLPARHFAIAFELAGTDFLQPTTLHPRPGTGPTNSPARPRPHAPRSGSNGASLQPAP